MLRTLKTRPNIALAGAVRISNVWFLEHDGERFIIDSGHPLERPSLKRDLRRSGISRGDITAILLTHRHSDHAGNAAWLKRELGGDVFCHEDDAAALSGSEDAPLIGGRSRSPFHDVLCRFEDRFPARCEVDGVYEGAEWRWGFEIIHVGGHTDGSVMLFHRPTSTLFTGDAILTGLPVQRVVVRPCLAVRQFCVDSDICHDAVRQYLSRNEAISTVCAGHGPAIVSRVSRHLGRLTR